MYKTGIHRISFSGGSSKNYFKSFADHGIWNGIFASGINQFSPSVASNHSIFSVREVSEGTEMVERAAISEG
jgi:hypothetical protein